MNSLIVACAMEREMGSRGYEFQIQEMSAIFKRVIPWREREYKMEGCLGSLFDIRSESKCHTCYDSTMQHSGYKNICYIICCIFAINIPFKT